MSPGKFDCCIYWDMSIVCQCVIDKATTSNQDRPKHYSNLWECYSVTSAYQARSNVGQTCILGSNSLLCHPINLK
eukprot:5965966-Ditylum_brightwellii.AAC.1